MRRVSLTPLFAALAVVCLLAPTPVAAQDDSLPLLWVSYVTAEPGKSDELAMHLAESTEELYAGLIADGYVLNRGVAQAANHFPGDDWTHIEWVNFRDWAAAGEFVNRFIASQRAMSPEDMAADAAKWDELTVHGSHYDEIARHLVFSSGAGRPAFIALSYFDTKLFAEDKAKELYETSRSPVLDPLVADGTILGHGMLRHEMHGGAGWEVASWVSMASLAGMDEVDRVVKAADAARSEEETAAWMSQIGAIFDLDGGSHSDRILVVMHFQQPEAPAEPGDE